MLVTRHLNAAPLSLLLMVVGGCATASEALDLRQAEDESAAPEEADDPPPDEFQDQAEPLFFGLNGELFWTEGVFEADGTLQLSLWDGKRGEPLCAEALEFSATLSDELPEDASLWLQWEVTLDPSEHCAPADWPERFSLGFGPADLQLAPAASAADLPLSSLYGLYLQVPGDPLFLFGVAGTEAQFAGEQEPTEIPEDGLYILQDLYLLPL